MKLSVDQARQNKGSDINSQIDCRYVLSPSFSHDRRFVEEKIIKKKNSYLLNNCLRAFRIEIENKKRKKSIDRWRSLGMDGASPALIYFLLLASIEGEKKRKIRTAVGALPG